MNSQHTDHIDEFLDDCLYRFANYIKRHEKTGLGHPKDNQSAIKQVLKKKLEQIEREARIDEHYKMTEMITATDMQTQYKEYWRAGNIRLAMLKESSAPNNSEGGNGE